MWACFFLLIYVTEKIDRRKRLKNLNNSNYESYSVNVTMFGRPYDYHKELQRRDEDYALRFGTRKHRAEILRSCDLL